MEPRNVDDLLQTIKETEDYIEEQIDHKVIMFADLVESTRYKATHSTQEGLKRTYIHNSIATACI